MRQEDTSTEVRRAPGRPSKPDALSPADRAKRYREKQKTRHTSQADQRNEKPVTDKVADLEIKLLKLQLKYDAEHMTVINLQTENATLRQATVKKAGPNPLAKQVTKLQATVAEQDKIISAYSAEINRLRDDLASSRKSQNPGS